MLLCSCGAPNTYGDKGRESLSESAVPSDTEQRRTAPPSLSQEKAGPSATMETGLEYGRISGCCIVEPWDERLCSTALLFISRTEDVYKRQTILYHENLIIQDQFVFVINN